MLNQVKEPQKLNTGLPQEGMIILIKYRNSIAGNLKNRLII